MSTRNCTQTISLKQKPMINIQKYGSSKTLKGTAIINHWEISQ